MDVAGRRGDQFQIIPVDVAKEVPIDRYQSVQSRYVVQAELTCRKHKREAKMKRSILSLSLVLVLLATATLTSAGPSLAGRTERVLVEFAAGRAGAVRGTLEGAGGNIHYQFDRKRLFFFYTSDGRVDFRELAKELASIFKTRIELRQMGVRDEAKQMGGVGSCGREYCCSSFLSNFKRITTQIAADQNNSSNLSKMSGPCGKLKCCLSYELAEN